MSGAARHGAATLLLAVALLACGGDDGGGDDGDGGADAGGAIDAAPQTVEDLDLTVRMGLYGDAGWLGWAN